MTRTISANRSMPTPKSKARADAATRVSQTELASLSGVSRTTVSRALTGHPSISEPIRTRIQLLARQLNYRPNAAARSFVTRRHNTIGIVLCDRTLTSPIYAILASAVEDAAREAGLKLQISRCDSNEVKAGQVPPIFQDDGVDGVVLTGAVPEWLLQRLVEWHMPFALLASQQGVVGVNQVSGDPAVGGRLIAEHLLGLGHRRIGLLIGPRHRPIHAHYFSGFEGACLAAGMIREQVEAGVVECATNEVIEPMKALMRKMPDLTAIFVDTDFAAWEAVQYLRAIGKRVPDDISVAGAGDMIGMLIGAPNFNPQLTSIDVQLPEMGKAAVRLLRDVISAPGGTARRVVIEPRVIHRQTTAQVAGHGSPEGNDQSPFTSAN
jgi:LacI family transcriptional regulator